MGANYDAILSSADQVVQVIEAFLADRGLTVLSVAELKSVEITGDTVVLLSPSCAGLVQIVAHSAALRVELADWYQCNPLAAFLSKHGQSSLHVWSLDSGFVAGYSGYQHGTKMESRTVFSRHAAKTDTLIESVPIPPPQEGSVLRSLLHSNQWDTANWDQDALEHELARLMNRLGFDVHLVDLFEAVDDEVGIRIAGDDYADADLSEWTAILFEGDCKLT